LTRKFGNGINILAAYFVNNFADDDLPVYQEELMSRGPYYSSIPEAIDAIDVAPLGEATFLDEAPLAEAIDMPRSYILNPGQKLQKAVRITNAGGRRRSKTIKRKRKNKKNIKLI
jgi:hypothetical protein